MFKLYLFITIVWCNIHSDVAKLSPKKVKPYPPKKPTSNFTEKESTASTFQNPVFDIKYTEIQHDELRAGIPWERYRWRNGFFVQAGPGFTKRQYEIINAAVFAISEVLCIKVMMWPVSCTPTGDYVLIKRGNRGSGCYSEIGRLGGQQELNLQVPGCVVIGTVIHELIHALGYAHEHSRPDRDDHIDINFDNIIRRQFHDFELLDEAITFDVPYDIHSIMHYEGSAFSRNGLPTITAKNGEPVGTQGFMTKFDILKLKRMYNCTTTEVSPD